MDLTTLMLILLTALFLSVWLWAPLALAIKTRRYNRRHPDRATPRVWTRVDYLSFCSTLFFLGVLFLPIAIVLLRRSS